MVELMPAPLSQDDDLGLESHFQVVSRHRWFFLLPFFGLGLLGYIAANVFPLQCHSSALITVEQRKVPDQYVLPNVLMTLQKRLDGMTQQILSRTRLQRLIEDFGLYASARKSNSVDNVIDMMQKRISVDLVEPTGQTTGQRTSPNDLTGFRISFSDRDPYVAQRVTNELTSLFIEQDARDRTAQSQETTSFLQSQLEEGRKQLAAEEEKLHDYKLKHLGELPDQEKNNLIILGSLEAQLQANTSALDRAEQQRTYLESMRSQQQALLADLPIAAPTGKSNPSTPEQPAERARGTTSLEVAQSILADLWKQLPELSAMYTDRHPDVIQLKKEIADWEATVDRLRKERTAGAEIESHLKSVLAEIESERREANETRGRIRQIQEQLSQTPIRQQEIAELTGVYESAKANVQTLLQKVEGSALASNLEERQGGERFRLLDPATLPTKPEGRTKIVMVGWALAFAVGVGLVFLVEMLDKTVHKPVHIEPYNLVPVLAHIPTLRSAREQRRRKLHRKLEVIAVGVMSVISIASGVHSYLQH
jgi:polysaccharide chain length determinant protein (PEP-CTERM system associated)